MHVGPQQKTQKWDGTLHNYDTIEFCPWYLLVQMGSIRFRFLEKMCLLDQPGR
jgi:hypothetical protein